ncbi:MAG: alpha-1,2-fucosyltransferase [Ginsengibacter sp.]
MGIVICKIPKAGLGNQLFPLMRAYTFGRINNLPVLVYNYHQLKIGPWLRQEKNKRNYKGFFNFEKNPVAAQIDRWKALQNSKTDLVLEPGIERLKGDKIDGSYLFTSVPHYEHHFDGLQERRNLVLQIFWNLVSRKIKRNLDKLQKPCIGVHIRLGDFKKAVVGVKFGTIGHTRSPEEYFVNMINSIRKVHGSLLPVTVFTDGRKSELQQLFALENIFLSEGNDDLTDLLLLSKSEIVITSAGSTFSYWAAFISESIVLVHPTYINLKIRPVDDEGQLYEGAFDEKNEFLIRKIQSIVK